VSQAWNAVRHGFDSVASQLKPAWAKSPEEYERGALKEIDRLKNPEPSRLESTLDVIRRPMAKMADSALDSKVGAVISRGVQGMINVIVDRASWSVQTDVIYGELRSRGHDKVRAARDIQELELRDVDAAVGHLRRKSEVLAFAEGMSTGVLGFAGAALDIPGLVGIALRAISEYAVYYGFNPARADESAFVLMLLALVSAPTIDERQAAMARLSRLSVVLTDGDPRGGSRRLLSMQMVTKIGQTVANRLVKAKMAQFVPTIGAGVAAAFNAWFASRVTQTAFQLYRERFLIRKRGPQIAVPVRPLSAAPH
jgi:hypothetical protein